MGLRSQSEWVRGAERGSLELVLASVVPAKPQAAGWIVSVAAAVASDFTKLRRVGGMDLLLAICGGILETFGLGLDGVGRFARKIVFRRTPDWRGLRWYETGEIGNVDAEGSEGVGAAVFVFEEFHRVAEAAGAAAAVAGGADVVFERAADSFFDPFEFERVGRFAADDVEDFAEELPGLASAECAGFGAGEAVGEGAFEHPGGGAPVSAGGVLHRAAG